MEDVDHKFFSSAFISGEAGLWFLVRVIKSYVVINKVSQNNNQAHKYGVPVYWNSLYRIKDSLWTKTNQIQHFIVVKCNFGDCDKALGHWSKKINHSRVYIQAFLMTCLIVGGVVAVIMGSF